MWWVTLLPHSKNDLGLTGLPRQFIACGRLSDCERVITSRTCDPFED